MATLPYQVERKTCNSHVVRMNYGPGFWQKFMISSDWHWDNPKTKRKMLKRHLEEAKAQNAGVFVFGDLFCAMQGSYDPRKSKSDILPEHNKANYLDALIDTAVEWLLPYAHNIVLISPGNHETAILKRQETDLIARLVEKLNAKAGTSIQVGGYSGYVRFAFSKTSGSRLSKKLWYHHGFGGGGPVTRGVIQTNRRSVFVPDADIIASGHIHESWYLENVRQRLTASDEIVLDTQYHICLPTYKEEYAQGKGGFHIEKGRPPKPLGAWWCEFYYEEQDVKMRFTRAE
jgi:hypothetical protein